MLRSEKRRRSRQKGSRPVPAEGTERVAQLAWHLESPPIRRSGATQDAHALTWHAQLNCQRAFHSGESGGPQPGRATPDALPQPSVACPQAYSPSDIFHCRESRLGCQVACEAMLGLLASRGGEVVLERRKPAPSAPSGRRTKTPPLLSGAREEGGRGLRGGMKLRAGKPD